MDQVFAQLALQTVSFMGKAAIGVATNLAVRRIQTVVNSRRRLADESTTAAAAIVGDETCQQQQLRSQTVPSSTVDDELTQIERLNAGKLRLERKMAALGPALDLVERMDSDSRFSNIRALADWSRDIKLDVDRLNSALVSIDSTGGLAARLQQSASLDSGGGLAELSGSSASGGLSAAPINSHAIASIADRLEAIVNRLDEICPYIQLALSVNVPSSQQQQRQQQIINSRSSAAIGSTTAISLARLLQAARQLNYAHAALEKESIAFQPAFMDLMGVRLTVRLYKLSIGSVKRSVAAGGSSSNLTPTTRTTRHHFSSTPTAASAAAISSKSSYDSTYDQQWQWQELYAKCNVLLRLFHSASATPYRFQLLLEQDKNDGRYHEYPDRRSALEFELTAVQKMFYADSGRLLKLADSNQPCLVMKLLPGGSPATRETSKRQSNAGTNLQTPVKSSDSGPNSAEYFALELLPNENATNDDNDATDEAEDDDETTSSSDSADDRDITTSNTTTTTKTNTTNNNNNNNGNFNNNSDGLQSDESDESPSRGRGGYRLRNKKSLPKDLFNTPRRRQPHGHKQPSARRELPRKLPKEKPQELRSQLERLSVFDYTLRLCMMEMTQKCRTEEMSDDKLLLEFSSAWH